MFLVSLNCLLVMRFGIFAFLERFVSERETEMRFREVRIQIDRLLKGCDRFCVLVVEVQLLAFIQQCLCLRMVSIQTVGHFCSSGTIIRGLLTGPFATQRKHSKHTEHNKRISLIAQELSRSLNSPLGLGKEALVI